MTLYVFFAITTTIFLLFYFNNQVLEYTINTLSLGHLDRPEHKHKEDYQCFLLPMPVLEGYYCNEIESLVYGEKILLVQSGISRMDGRPDDAV